MKMTTASRLPPCLVRFVRGGALADEPASATYMKNIFGHEEWDTQMIQYTKKGSAQETIENPMGH